MRPCDDILESLQGLGCESGGHQTCERAASSVELERGEEEVSGVERVHEVWRERRALLALGNLVIILAS